MAEGAKEAYEPPQIAARIVLLTGAGLFAIVLASFALIAGSFRVATGHFPWPAEPMPASTPPPAPTLQIRPGDDLLALRQSEDERLGAKAALPIDRAMAAIARRGRAAFDPLVPARDPRPGQP